MVGNTLVGFLRGRTNLLRGDVSLPEYGVYFWHTKCHTRWFAWWPDPMPRQARDGRFLPVTVNTD